MSNFIQLNRTFRKLDTDKDQTDEAYKINLAFGLTKNTLWTDILEHERAIILAEAGAGKTEEFEHIANTLIAEGKTAFFLRLEHLSDNLKTAFEIGSFSDFESWKDSSETAYFFLDSVDEAKLIDEFQFERAVRLFAAEIGHQNLHRIKVYISSRVTRWQPRSDLAFIKRHLPFYEEDTENDNDEIDNVLDVAPTEATSNQTARLINLVDGTPLVVGMQGLDNEQMKIYAVAKDLTPPDADKMMAEIYSLEVEDLASRPKDLDDIIGFWETDKRVGTRLDLIERSFKNRVTEDDPKRKQKDPLTFERAQEGARKLAAAVTFQQINRILVPDAIPVTEGIDAEQILANWSTHEIQSLLQRPLFEEQTYGTVRFYHRSVREYLTAEWLNAFLKNDKSRRDIEAIFFRNQHGLDVIVPTSRPVLSWMVLLDDAIREKTQKIAPEVFVKNGDVSRLPLAKRKALLSQMCGILATKGFGRTYFTNTELYRFGKTDMKDHIKSLASKYQDHDDVLDVLLVMAERRKIDIGTGIAVSVVKDKKREKYTRVNALDYLQSRSDKALLSEIADDILQDETENNQRLLAWIVRNFEDCSLTPTQVVAFLSRFEPKHAYRYDQSYSAILEVIDKFSSDQCFEFVDAVSPLLKTEPLLERNYLEISQNYKWLYTSALKAFERLIRAKDERIFDPRFIELLSFSIRSHDFRDAEGYNVNFSEIIPAFPSLNDTLFWYSIESARTEEKEVKHFRNGKFWRRNWAFSSENFDRVLEWVSSRDLEDDKLVALSLAFSIYRENGRGDKRRRQLWKVVKGNEVLEKQLRDFLNPKAMSKESRNYQRQERRWEKQAKERKVKQAQILKDWQEYLASDEADKLLDFSIAVDGKMWQGNSYLMDRARKRNSGSDKWASKEWRSLISVYGLKAAERYKDAAISYWRHYDPVESQNSSSTSYATIFGLTGLAIEARESPNWLDRLGSSEAELAMKYAYQEMNGFPFWLEELFGKFPKVVLSELLKDIEHEFRYREADGHYFGAIHKITWRDTWLYPSLGPHLIELFRKHDPKHRNTLLYSLGIILQCTDIPKSEILSLIQERIEKTADQEVNAIWFAAWTNVCGRSGLEIVKEYVDALAEEEQTSFVMSWITMLLGDRFETLRSEFRDFKEVSVLKDMYIFVYQHIRSAEDTDRAGKGVYTPNLRDNAQTARNTIFNLLSEIPGRKTFDAFMEFSEIHPEEAHRPWYVHHARERAEKDADSTPWKADDFAAFEKSATRRPQNHQEVFDLCRSRLMDIKHHLENGDDSQAIAMVQIDQETTHRNYFVKEFRDKSNGFYTVTPEEELADKKRVDLRLHGSGLDSPVPIELKLAGNWTGDAHFERLENQLMGDYLRDMRSSRGVFMLVNRGKKKRWDTKDGKRRNFDQLVSALQDHANTLLKQAPHIEEIKVMGIDLTVRA